MALKEGSSMKNVRISRASAVLISASAILLCGSLAVNHFAKYPKANHQPALVADGYPIPPLPPGSQLVADGYPIPPLPPGRDLLADGYPIPPLPPGSTLVADGYPIPPLPPGMAANSQFLADGYPIPPLPPDSTLVADGYPIPPLPPMSHVTQSRIA
jgi:hypothetical protein